MFEILKSERNADIINFREFLFRKSSVYGNNTYWRCIRNNCSARLVLNVNYNDNRILNDFEIEHNHSEEHEKILRLRKYDEMKKRLENQHLTPIRNVIADSLMGEGRETLSKIGNPESIKRKLRTYKDKLINPKPYLYNQLMLSSRLSHTVRNESFYRYGPENFGPHFADDNILIFFSDSMVDLLFQNEIWCVDGTFNVVPAPYYQLYTISFLINNHVYPSIFVILKNKSLQTYNNMFDLIFNMKGIPNPKVIKTDFEKAVISCLKTKFPRSQISGCSFHLGQAIQRKLKECGLFQFYKSNASFKKSIKSLNALAYVDKEMVRETFFELKNSSTYSIICGPMYDYFFSNYIGEPNMENNVRYPIEIWNSLDDLNEGTPRTNNAAEGFHNAFASSFLNSKHSFPLLVDRLVHEEEITQQKYLWAQLGFEAPLKRKYLEMEENIKNYINSKENKFGADYVFGILDFIFY